MEACRVCVHGSAGMIRVPLFSNDKKTALLGKMRQCVDSGVEKLSVSVHCRNYLARPASFLADNTSMGLVGLALGQDEQLPGYVRGGYALYLMLFVVSVELL